MKQLRVVVAFALVGFALAARGQAYPTHAVTMIVPFSAGGPTDTKAD